MRRLLTVGTIASFSVLLAMVSPARTIAATVAPKVVIKVEHVGGFVGPNFLSARLPDVVLYSDGRLLASSNTNGSVRQMFQGSVSKALLQSQVSAFMKAMKTPTGGWGLPGVADVPSTEVTLVQNGQNKVLSVYALGFALNSSLKEASVARKVLSKTIDKLIALAGKSKTYTPLKYEIWPQDPISNGSGTGIVWPKNIAPPTSGCVSVVAKPFLSLLRSAGSKQWLLPSGSMITLTWRPVLPGENACKR